MKPPLLNVPPAALLLLALMAGVPLQAQTSTAPSAESASAPPTAQFNASASSILNPAISNLQAALDGIRVEKWKASGAVRDEAQANLDSVRRDLDDTLPPLLTTADATPDSVPQVLPVYRNIEALYDVLLRISSVARLTAPPQQSAAMDQAMSTLESARRHLGDQLQSSAAIQEKKAHDLQASLRAQPPSVSAPAPCPPAPAAVKKRKTPPKTSPKPAATAAPVTNPAH